MSRIVDKCKPLPVGNLLGETIWRVHNDTPVSFNKL